MRYRTYRLSLCISKAFSAMTGLPKLKPEELLDRDWQECFSIGLSALSHDRDSELAATTYSMAAEYLWWRAGRPVCYVRRDVIPVVMNARHSINLSAIRVPLGYPVICFAFPDGCLIAGSQIAPVLFGTQDIYRVVGECLGLPYDDAQDPSWFVIKRHPLGHYVSRLKSDVELKQFLNHDQAWLDRTFNVTPGEAEDQNAYGRLAFGLSVYCQAFPDSIVAGWPDDMSARDAKVSGVSEPRHIGVPDRIKQHGGHASPVSHWRSGHFRVLGDPRFKHNPDGSPKIIYVNDAIIRRDIKPYTVMPPRV